MSVANHYFVMNICMCTTGASSSSSSLLARGRDRIAAQDRRHGVTAPKADPAGDDESDQEGSEPGGDRFKVENRTATGAPNIRRFRDEDPSHPAYYAVVDAEKHGIYVGWWSADRAVSGELGARCRRESEFYPALRWYLAELSARMTTPLSCGLLYRPWYIVYDRVIYVYEAFEALEPWLTGECDVVIEVVRTREEAERKADLEYVRRVEVCQERTAKSKANAAKMKRLTAERKLAQQAAEEAARQAPPQQAAPPAEPMTAQQAAIHELVQQAAQQAAQQATQRLMQQMSQQATASHSDEHTGTAADGQSEEAQGGVTGTRVEEEKPPKAKRQRKNSKQE
jgi:hypothetical protein